MRINLFNLYSKSSNNFTKMITPEILIESFESYRPGEKNFCKLASVSKKDDGVKKYLGFWLEVIENDDKLVLSIQFESLRSEQPVQIEVFFEKEHLEHFVESARQSVAYELEKIVHRKQSCIRCIKP